MEDVSLRIDSKDLKALAKDIKGLEDPKPLLKELRTELRGVVKPFVPKLRAAINQIQSRGGQPSQSARSKRRGTLRNTMSRSVSTQVRLTGRSAGASVFMNPRKMPDGMKSLPAYFEQRGGYERLRHPLFGNKERWFQQTVPTQGYFTRTVRPMETDAQRAVRGVMDNMANKIEGK